MKAWTIAQKLYEEEECPRTLEEDFRLHVANPQGCVIKLPDVIALARPVDKNAGQEIICNPKYWFAKSLINCWHLYLLVGDAGAAWQYLPFELDWMSYERRNVLRIAPFCRMKSLLCHDFRPTISSK